MIQRLPRRIGTAAAKRMMLTAREVGAAEAQALGLVDVLAPAGGLDAAIADLAGAILTNSWHTNCHTKRLLAETDGMSIEQGLAYEQYRYPGFAPDHAERVARFARKQG